MSSARAGSKAQIFPDIAIQLALRISHFAPPTRPAAKPKRAHTLPFALLRNSFFT